MRISVLTSSYPRFPGDGTAPFIQSIAEHMAKLGHEIEVVAPYDPLVIPSNSNKVKVHRFRYVWPKKLHIMGHARSLEADVRIRPLAFILLPLFLLASLLKLLKVTKKQNTQAIHVHWVLPNGPVAALVAAWRGIPFIVSLHGSDIYVANNNNIFKVITRWVLKKSAGITACSSELREKAIELGASDDVTLLPWGIDPNIFHNNYPKSYLNNWTEIETEQTIVIGLGRLVYKKGFENLLQAWSILTRAAIIPAHLVIGGDGPLRSSLIRQSEILGISHRVTFIGQVPWNEVPKLFNSSDIFVLPSIRDKYGNIDGLPTVLLEAMGCGQAVIASNLGGIPLVIVNGENGILIPADDINALVQALQDLINNPQKRNNLGLKARKTITENHTWDKVARKIVKLIE